MTVPPVPALSHLLRHSTRHLHHNHSHYRGCRQHLVHRHRLLHSRSLRPFSSSSSLAPFSAPSDPISSLTDWVLSSGGLCSKVSLRPSALTGRAIHALQPISAWETAIRVPLSCLLTTTAAIASDIGRLLEANARPFKHSSAFLSSFLLQERAKGASSPFHAYIAALPTSYSSHPLYYSDATLDLLRGCLALPVIRGYARDVYADYLTLMLAQPQWSLDDFMWARSAVSSRGFGACVDGEKEEVVLVPYIDLINHCTQPNTQWGWEDSTKSFVTQARRKIGEGEEISESYGDKVGHSPHPPGDPHKPHTSPLRLAAAAHLLPPRSPPAVSATPLCWPTTASSSPTTPTTPAASSSPLPPSDERSRMRKTSLLHLLNDNTAEEAEFTPPAAYTEEAERLLSHLRVAHADDADLTALFDAEKTEPPDRRRLRVQAGEAKRARIVGKANEARVWAAVGEEVRRRLGEFGETAEDDERMLAEGRWAAGSGEEQCVRVRLGEKRVLGWWGASSRLMLRLLEGEIPALIDAEEEVDAQGWEEYRVNELGPLLRRWRPDSRQARFA